MSFPHRQIRLIVALAIAAGVSACGSDSTSSAGGPGRHAGPSIDPADFSARIDNPYLPLIPGTVTRYRGESADGTETVKVAVTRRTRPVMGVATVVVRDTSSLDGEVAEDTFDWYAQDREGNVWYFGEDTKELEHGKVVSTEGSWEAGVDGAEPGIVMLVHPKVGDRYRQEYSKGAAEDMARVLSLDAHATVPFGSFDHLLLTRDFTPLEPKNVEHKYYARGIGSVLEVTLGQTERLELVDVHRP